MTPSSENAVIAALEAAVRDHGWLAAGDPARLRGTLSDLLGASAETHRGAVDALVISAEEGVPAALREAGRSGAASLRPELVARLTDWGLAEDRAAWVVEAWESLVPESTMPPPVATTLPPPPADPEPAEPEPVEPEPAEPAPGVTALPPETPAAGAPAPKGPAPEATSLPPAPVAATSLPPVAPVAAAATSLPPAAAPPEQAAPENASAERGASEEPRGPATGNRNRRWAWIAAAAVVGLVGAGGALAATRDDGGRPVSADPTSTPSPTVSESPDVAALPSGQLVATTAAEPAPAGPEAALAGRKAGVRVAALGPVDQIGDGADARVAAEGDQLVAFTLAKGPCQEKPCGPWRSLRLSVDVDGTAQRLPDGGPTYAVSAPVDAPVELVMRGDGIEQRISLVDGEPTGDNIAVLLRTDRRTQVGETRTISPQVSAPGGGPLGFPLTNTQMTATVRSAELFFFQGAKHPRRTDQAYLRADLTYTRAGSADRFVFPAEDLTFVPRGGQPIKPIDLDPSAGLDLVFVVPADLTRGQLVVSGTRLRETNLGEQYQQTLPRTTFPVRFG